MEEKKLKLEKPKEVDSWLLRKFAVAFVEESTVDWQNVDDSFDNDTFKLKGKLQKVNLLDINSTDELIEKVINPVIQIYEQQ